VKEKILKIINDLFVRLYFNIQVLGRQPFSLNVMSIRFSADSIGAPLTQDTSTFITTNNNHHQDGEMSVESTSMVNSNCSKMETQSLMDITSMGRPTGTPDAVDQASYMSSDFTNSNINNNKNQQQQAFGESVNMQDMFAQLSESLALEPKYQPNLFLPLQSNVSFFTVNLKYFLELNFLILSLFLLSYVRREKSQLELEMEQHTFCDA
jgi:hypothetical protein